jgi:hypothetical protein
LIAVASSHKQQNSSTDASVDNNRALGQALMVLKKEMYQYLVEML